MTIIEMIFLGSISVTLLFLIGDLLNIVQLIRLKSRIQKQIARKSRNKKKRARIIRKRRVLEAQYRKTIRLVGLCSILTIFFAGVSGCIYHYQTTSLSSKDSVSVVKGHYLVKDFEEQLKLVKEEAIDENEFQQNVRYLATAMASYGVEKASDLNSKDGQLILNRYYSAIQQLGMNASTQTKNFYNDQQLVDTFLADIKQTKKAENGAVSYFKVDEKTFKEK